VAVDQDLENDEQDENDEEAIIVVPPPRSAHRGRRCGVRR